MPEFDKTNKPVDERSPRLNPANDLLESPLGDLASHLRRIVNYRAAEPSSKEKSYSGNMGAWLRARQNGSDMALTAICNSSEITEAFLTSRIEPTISLGDAAVPILNYISPEAGVTKVKRVLAGPPSDNATDIAPTSWMQSPPILTISFELVNEDYRLQLVAKIDDGVAFESDPTAFPRHAIRTYVEGYVAPDIRTCQELTTFSDLKYPHKLRELILRKIDEHQDELQRILVERLNVSLKRMLDNPERKTLIPDLKAIKGQLEDEHIDPYIRARFKSTLEIIDEIIKADSPSVLGGLLRGLSSFQKLLKRTGSD